MSVRVGVCVLAVRDLHTSATHLLRYQAAERTGEKQTFELEAEDIRDRRGCESREQPQEKTDQEVIYYVYEGKDSGRRKDIIVCSL